MATSTTLQNNKASMDDLYAELRKISANMTLPPILITGSQSRSSFPNIGGIKAGQMSIIAANPSRGKSMLGPYFYDYESSLAKDYLDILSPGDKLSDSLIMCQRARKIFDSCTTESKKVSMTSYAYKILESENSYFLFDYNDSISQYIRGPSRVQIRVGNLIIPLPIHELNIGQNPFVNTTPNPNNGVERVIGEIADFVSDYFDDFGYYADAE
jgi:hypothetical protein